MNRIVKNAAPLAVAALLVAGSAFAGGASCGRSDACPTAKAGQNIYSFAVPGAECDNCVNSIETALMAQKGVSCAHVDLTTRTTYVIADRSFDRKAIAKCIQTAGFRNSYKAQGAKVQAEFAKSMASGSGKAAASCRYKESKAKDKI